MTNWIVRTESTTSKVCENSPNMVTTPKKSRTQKRWWFKMRILKTVLVVVALSVICVPDAFAQWTQNQGEFYGKIGADLKFGSAAYNLEAESVSIGDFYMLNFSTYAEYGATDDLSVTLNSVVFALASHNDRLVPYGGPVLLGARYQYLKSDVFVASIEARAGYDAGIGEKNIATDDSYVFNPSRGDGGVLDLVSQFGFSKWLFFGAIDGGIRSNIYADPSFDLISSARVGLSGLPLRVTIEAGVALNWAIEKPVVFNATGASPTRYLGTSLAISSWVTQNFGWSLSYRGSPYAVANASSVVYGLAFVFRGDAIPNP